MAKSAVINSQLLSMFDRILDLTDDWAYRLTITLYSSVGEEFSYEIPRLDQLLAIQQFTTTSFDWWTFDIEVTVADYLALVEHVQGLYAFVELRRRSARDSATYELIWRSNYSAVITSSLAPAQIKDIRKHLPNAENIGAPELQELFPMSIELYETAAISLRKYGAALIARDQNMHQLLELFAAVYGIESVVIVPPDNTRSYDQIVVPRSLDLRSAFAYFQSAPGFGIYNEGVSVYYHNETLYVFPAARPRIDDNFDPVHLIIVPEDLATGLTTSFYQTDTGALYAVCAGTEQQQQERSLTTLENRGNAAYLLQQDTLTGTAARTVKNGQVTIADDVLSIKGIGDTSWGLTEDPHTPIFHLNGGNDHAALSFTTLGLGTVLTLLWYNAKPFQLLPGHPVVCYYIDTVDATTNTGQSYTVLRQVIGTWISAIYTFDGSDLPGDRGLFCRGQLSVLIGSTE